MGEHVNVFFERGEFDLSVLVIASETRTQLRGGKIQRFVDWYNYSEETTIRQG